MSALTKAGTWTARVREDFGLVAVLLVFLLVACFVDPIREVATDDDWSYARTVHHLLETGQYRLDDWSAANMPVQIYWEALFAGLFGYSFTALTLSTMILALAGWVAFYWLLRDFGSNDAEASLLTLILLSSPLVLRFSFTFMNDVQFLGWLVLALWLYMRALSRHSYVYMALASAAAAAAIGTRPFGVALPAGLFFTWILGRERLKQAPRYAVGLLLPVLAGVWQFWFGLSNPTFAMAIRLNQTSAYLSDLANLVIEVFWRPTVIFQYVGLFLLPLLPYYALLLLRSMNARTRADLRQAMEGEESNKRTRRHLVFLALWTVYIVAGVTYGYVARGLRMPSLPWNLDLLGRDPRVTTLLTVLTAAVAILLGWLLSRRYLDRYQWKAMSQAEQFLVLTAIAQLGLQLVYVQFADRYLIVFLPFVLFALRQGERHWPRWCTALTAALCLGALLASALWARSVADYNEAQWQAAESVRSTGVPAEQIWAGWTWRWNNYYSAFQEWVDWTEATGQNPTDIMPFFEEWGPQRRSEAVYWIVGSSDAPTSEKWQVLGKIGYRSELLRQQHLYIVKRDLGQ